MKPLFDFDGNGNMDELEFLLATGAISLPGNDNPFEDTDDGFDDNFDDDFDDIFDDDSDDGFDSFDGDDDF